MAKKKLESKSPQVVKGYTLKYYPKVADARAKAGGDEDLILAYYDKRGGRIEDKDGNEVPRGTFWDVEKGQPKKAAAKEEK